MPKRVDDNHAEIVQALRAHGASCFSLARLGRGAPDVCIGFRGVTQIAEIKNKTGKLNDRQREWHRSWRGSPVVILRSTDDVVTLIQTLDRYYTELGQTIANTFTKEDHDRTRRTKP